MSQEKKKTPNIMEYYSWVASQKFKNPKEHHLYVSYQEQDFLQKVIYPMFYQDTHFKTTYPFPLVLKDYSSRNPMYAIDTRFFTIVFFSFGYLDGEMCWEVSVHVKDHDFCDEKILSFAKWYREHYIPDIRLYFIDMEKMPEEFLYPKLNFYSKEVQDFCIEFWNEGRDFMLFKLFDLLRLF